MIENCPKLIRVKELAEMLSLSCSSLDNIRKEDPSFPKAIKLGARATGFFIHEIDEWLESRREKR